MGILIIFKVPPTLFPNQSPLGRREKLDRSESSQHGGPAGNSCSISIHRVREQLAPATGNLEVTS